MPVSQRKPKKISSNVSAFNLPAVASCKTIYLKRMADGSWTAEIPTIAKSKGGTPYQAIEDLEAWIRRLDAY